MKWYAIDQKTYDSDLEQFLYTGTAFRMLVFVGLTTDGQSRCVTYSFAPDVEHVEWRSELTTEELEDVIQRACLKLPNQEKRIREQAAKEQMSRLPLQLTRIGPACPAIIPFTGTYVVHEELIRRLDGAGLKFLETQYVKALPLQWNLGEPAPTFLEKTTPSEYIESHPHCPATADKIGTLYEMRVPEIRWQRPSLIASTATEWQRVSFGVQEEASALGDEPSIKPVKLAFMIESDLPWIRLRPPDDCAGEVYELVREDLLETLLEPGRWTMEFLEVDCD